MSEKKTLTRSELEILIKKRAAIWITILAALLAINAMVGGSNSSKITTNTITASRLWTWYGDKKIDAKMHEMMAKALATDAVPSNNHLVAEFLAEAQRLRTEPVEGMADLSKQAKALEAERDRAAKRSPFFNYAGMALQLAVVLSTAAILAVSMQLFVYSLAAGSIGSALLLFVLVGV